jgi:hypothetical protein
MPNMTKSVLLHRENPAEIPGTREDPGPVRGPDEIPDLPADPTPTPGPDEVPPIKEPPTQM